MVKMYHGGGGCCGGSSNKPADEKKNPADSSAKSEAKPSTGSCSTPKDGGKKGGCGCG